MNISNFRYNITVQQKLVTKNSYGAESVQWIDYLKLKASKKEIGGTKTVDNSEVFNTGNLVFETYCRPITADMRIEYAGSHYKINNIAEIGYKQGLAISVELINE